MLTIDLTSTLKLFTSLYRAPGAVWTEATRRKAPHKPLLLLAVLDLVHRGVITTPFIDVTADLVEFNSLEKDGLLAPKTWSKKIL
ncbi:hypothetical protein GeomeDRAFT_0672 [Geobacter metallireducens RCH3]|uniref:hypothetical protein n=1 Tax=Geobacter metallireducens TaxID=28232 RepID=UPI00003865E3|nr:hypothetical protein [Geobacter metallireducens]EHP88790.1 hypothetical protein GeomeDRAFT_0672 [Geobacter metallireducens RCH3]